VNTVRPLTIDDAICAAPTPAYVQLSDPLVQGNADVKHLGKSAR